jgi:hypothetical protein
VLDVFDELYDALHTGEPLRESFVRHLNDTHGRLVPALAVHRAQAREAAAHHVLGATGPGGTQDARAADH